MISTGNLSFGDWFSFSVNYRYNEGHFECDYGAIVVLSGDLTESCPAKTDGDLTGFCSIKVDGELGSKHTISVQGLSRSDLINGEGSVGEANLCRSDLFELRRRFGEIHFCMGELEKQQKKDTSVISASKFGKQFKNSGSTENIRIQFQDAARLQKTRAILRPSISSPAIPLCNSLSPTETMTNIWCLLCLCVWCFMSVVVKAESVDTLLSIASDLGYSGWKGTEPCQPHWYGVNCIGGRIYAITLIGENLTGVISPRFADITSLRVIDLSHNHLRGTIPSELTRLNLASLDLSYNQLQLHGKVPPFKPTVVQLQGNPGIDVLPGSKTQGNVRGLIIGIIVISVLIIGVACLAVYREMRRRRRRRRPEPREVTTLDEY